MWGWYFYIVLRSPGFHTCEANSTNWPTASFILQFWATRNTSSGLCRGTLFNLRPLKIPRVKVKVCLFAPVACLFQACGFSRVVSAVSVVRLFVVSHPALFFPVWDAIFFPDGFSLLLGEDFQQHCPGVPGFSPDTPFCSRCLWVSGMGNFFADHGQDSYFCFTTHTSWDHLYISALPPLRSAGLALACPWPFLPCKLLSFKHILF